MKIMQIIPHLGSGGAERFVVDLSNELVRNGNDVILCTMYDMEGSLGFYKDDIDARVRVVSLHKRLGFSFGIILSLIGLVRREKPDVLHSHINVLQYSFLPQLFMSKGFHTVHNEAHLEVSGKFEVLLRKFLFRFDGIQPVAISPESKDSFLSFYNKNVPLINNGRNVENIEVSPTVKREMAKYIKSDHTKVIVQIARFHPQKNIPMMAKVASRLCAEGYDFSLLFIGNTENKKVLEEVKNIMPSCAFILGERKNPLEYLKEAGCLALSSLYEGFPISLIEALGVGAIPVCTPVGGIPNVVVDGKNGFLSDDNKEDSYYCALKRYLEADKETLDEMKQNALNSFHPYSMEQCAKQYVDLYESKLKA